MKKNIILIIFSGLISLVLIFFAFLIYNMELQATHLHNLWNVSYNSSQEEDKSKQEYLREALRYYSWSLNVREHWDTRFNYEFVKNLLQEKQQQEKSEENQDMQQEGDKSELTTSDDKQSSEESQKNNTQQQVWQSSNERWEWYSLDESQEIWEMTEEEERFLEEVFEKLEEEQIYNQKYYNKQPQESSDPFAEMQKRFFGEIYRGGEKDW